MIRLLAYLIFSALLAAGLAFVFSTEGSVLIRFGDITLQPRLGTALVALLIVFVIALFVVWLIRRILKTPAAINRMRQRAGERRAVDALGDSLIALEAGDAQKARALARDAADRLKDPLAAKLIEARASLKLTEWTEARDTYRDLLNDPRTAVAALSGLYEQARAQNRTDAALTFAQKAHALAPKLEWANHAVFQDLIEQGNWKEALSHLEAQNPRNKADKDARQRKLTIVQTALAASLEDKDPNTALAHAHAALKLDANFVPATLIAARLMSSKGEVRKAASLLRRVWRHDPHPHLAMLYAHVQPGVSPAQRLTRLKELVPNPPQDRASAIVFAQVAIEADDWIAARNALAGYAAAEPTRDICLAMAEIEEGQNHDHGLAREWLARAVNASADPAWTADGQTFDEWQPLSPASKQFDALRWKVPLVSPALVPTGHTRKNDPPAPAQIKSDDTDIIDAELVDPSDQAKPVN